MYVEVDNRWKGSSICHAWSSDDETEAGAVCVSRFLECAKKHRPQKLKSYTHAREDGGTGGHESSSSLKESVSHKSFMAIRSSKLWASERSE